MILEAGYRRLVAEVVAEGISVLRQAGFRAGSGTDAALAVYRAAEAPEKKAKAS